MRIPDAVPMITRWRQAFRERKQFTTTGREPFYALAAQYATAARVSVDIGGGYGEFLDYLSPAQRTSKQVYLLEQNPASRKTAQHRHPSVSVLPYTAPNRLPFDSGIVEFVHCSHIVEHLNPSDLYALLQDIDRVLRVGGILVISAPLLSSTFYGDFSHVKPYNPRVFLNYLSGRPDRQSTATVISTSYQTVRLVYRYTDEAPDGWGSPNAAVDLPIWLGRKVLYRLGVRRYAANGFTLVLRKEGAA
jgi:SAM-dependent methyltransferase